MAYKIIWNMLIKIKFQASFFLNLYSLYKDVLSQDHEACTSFLCIFFGKMINVSGISYVKLAVGLIRGGGGY